MTSFDGGKRYNSYAAFLKQKFGCRVAKLSLDAGFSCPNRDGSKGVGGCSFCSGRGSGDFAGDPAQTLQKQLAQQKALLRQKWPQARYIAYFQAHTNTYAPLERLQELFEEPLADPEVLGLSIATRPDCLDEAKADYLAQLSQRCFVEVELGLQSVFDETGERINRCCTFEDFLAGYELLRQRQIPVCVHLIDGLPGESREMMLHSAKVVGQLAPHSVKLHLLHVLEGTALARDWARGELPLLSQEDYVSLICDQLEVLPPQVVIQRLTGDGDRRQLLGPLWSLHKRAVLNAIDKELIRRDSWQGKALASTGEGALSMKDILDFAKEILLERLQPDGVFVDFTMGNGHDTLYFARYLTQGKVYAFDVQQQALDNTRRRLEEAGGFSNVELILDSHHHLDRYVKEPIDAGVFNLGYLPGSDKSVTTQWPTTLEALEKALSLLKVGGVIVVVIYPGHAEGQREAQLLEDYCAQLDKHVYNTYKYALLNKHNPPYLVVAEKFIPRNRYTGEPL